MGDIKEFRCICCQKIFNSSDEIAECPNCDERAAITENSNFVINYLDEDAYFDSLAMGTRNSNILESGFIELEGGQDE